jgi:uncharacterized protein
LLSTSGARILTLAEAAKCIIRLLLIAFERQNGGLLMPYFALLYDVVDQFAEKRTPFRDAHLKLVRDAHARGEIFMAGALGQPALAALLIFQSETSEVAEDFARIDPYVRQGLVTHWRALPWTVVVESPASGRPKEP